MSNLDNRYGRNSIPDTRPIITTQKDNGGFDVPGKYKVSTLGELREYEHGRQYWYGGRRSRRRRRTGRRRR